MEKRILFIITGFVIGATIGNFLYYSITNQFASINLFLAISFGGGFFGIFQLTAFYTISHWLNGKLPLEEMFSLRIVLDFVINAIVGLTLAGLLHLLLLKFDTGMSLVEIWAVYRESFLILWILIVVLVLLYNIVMMVFYAYYHYAEGQIKNVIVERKQLKLQFEALKNQLSPHYLFNSLNTISSLIHQDTDRAEEFIRRLADTYNYVLKTHQQQLITLEKELEFVRAYYFLLCVRFKEGLKLEINIPDQLLQYKIPPLTIQILVENAIKHNVFNSEQPLTIYLGVVDNKELRVINNKTLAPTTVKSTHIGLDNIKKRYSYFTNKGVTINNHKDFEVRVPIINDRLISSAA